MRKLNFWTKTNHVRVSVSVCVCSVYVVYVRTGDDDDDDDDDDNRIYGVYDECCEYTYNHTIYFVRIRFIFRRRYIGNTINIIKCTHMSAILKKSSSGPCTFHTDRAPDRDLGILQQRTWCSRDRHAYGNTPYKRRPSSSTVPDEQRHRVVCWLRMTKSFSPALAVPSNTGGSAEPGRMVLLSVEHLVVPVGLRGCWHDRRRTDRRVFVRDVVFVVVGEQIDVSYYMTSLP